ncbi:MAG: hypothetical protein Ct9H90mP3_5780 [Flammeovirgaceae bacterium]|nr:MAG: hypothetical protein Ct9H90mP3_5780 [Flammeovirgaceae bacterium]
MLPGDFIVFKLTGNISTTPLGLSEGIIGILIKEMFQWISLISIKLKKIRFPTLFLNRCSG